MKKILNTYEATAADGAKVTVYEMQNSEGAGTRGMELSDGRQLTMVGERQLKVAGTDDVFLLDRPYAP